MKWKSCISMLIAGICALESFGQDGDFPEVGHSFLFLGMVGVGMTKTMIRSIPYLIKQNPHYEDQYGTTFNPEREARGIAIIPEDWVLVQGGEGGNYLEFRPEDFQLVDAYIAIAIDRSTGKIASEEHFFRRANSQKGMVDSEEPLDNEQIVIRYSFRDEQRGKNPWTVFFQLWPAGEAAKMLRKPSFVSGKSEEETREAMEDAMRVLRHWGYMEEFDILTEKVRAQNKSAE